VQKAELEESRVGEGRSESLFVLTVTFTTDNDAGDATEEAVDVLVRRGLGVREVARSSASLEQVFTELTVGDVPEAAEPRT
jgi:hypothetical protein